MDMREYLEDELVSNHTYLYNLVLVSLWSITEAKIDDIVYNFALADYSVLSRSEFSKITIPIAVTLRMKHAIYARTFLINIKRKSEHP